MIVYRISFTVIGAVNEPKAGWIDNTHGPTSIIMNSSLGIMRLHECDGNAITNMVPVDFVTNALIASVRDVALQTNRYYQCLYKL